MTAERWSQAVRRQVGLGRLLPLGGPRDGAWIAEAAAGSALRRAAEGVRGVRTGAIRIALADPEETYEPAVPPPPSALPPGPLRVSADFAVAADPTASEAEPLPTTAARLRSVLATAAAERLGLQVTEVDLRVTDLLDGEPAVGLSPEPPPPAKPDPVLGRDESAVAAAARSVPGVSRLTGIFGGPGRAVHIEEQRGGTALPRRHVRVELAVATDRRAVDVARAVRGGVTEALPDHPSVAVLVTAVDSPGMSGGLSTGASGGRPGGGV
ncbi:nucleopolyhedrovirus P10 family protein [Streptomyces yaanensis]|uniref:Nucleopolyhedrovirus P10 family protein n=1 Tax=Streptomyces yaanensis TaxID=1142239 RepID=A0ABV7SIT8_9ACTN|nr:nucleopolyhedrovirus P10 family protein [Streptomyces sp. CGMCC 4.7035]WNC01076.1 nucleopolyhedrovirus P10 family protein [Streptomyces sp. CGMCC 4.7035]